MSCCQSIVDTMAQSLLSLVWELISRVTTTFLIFGISESVSLLSPPSHQKSQIVIVFQVRQALDSTSFLSIWSYISDSQLKEVILVRFIMATVFVMVQYPLLTSTGPFVTELLGGRDTS